MGVDVISLGVRHKLRVRKPLDLIEDISRLFNANVHVVYYNYKRDDMFVSLQDLKKDSATENLVLELPECDYLQQHTSHKETFCIDFRSDILLKQLWEKLCNNYGHYNITSFSENKNYEIRIFRETIDFDMDAPYRWYGFIKNFTLPKVNYPDLNEYRKKIKKYADITGCDFVIYFPDQYQGELIFDQIYLPANELLRYINDRMFYRAIGESIKLPPKEGRHQFSGFNESRTEDNMHKSIILDIPDFILNKKESVSDDLTIDVLHDDFRDLKNESNNR